MAIYNFDDLILSLKDRGITVTGRLPREYLSIGLFDLTYTRFALHPSINGTRFEVDDGAVDVIPHYVDFGTRRHGVYLVDMFILSGNENAVNEIIERFENCAASIEGLSSAVESHLYGNGISSVRKRRTPSKRVVHKQ